MSRSKTSPAARDEARRDALRGLRLGGGMDPRPRADEEAAAQPSPSALRLLEPSAPQRAPGLPTLATAGDVREAVRYLCKKSSGVSLAEAAEDLCRRVFEPRKVAAYEAWGLVERRGERIRLTASGRELAARLAPGAEGYRALLARTELYHAALEWVARECGELVTHQEVAAFWRQLCGGLGAAGGEDEEEEARAVCFFQVCQAAALGTLTVGKRGQPSRLRVERDELADYLARARRLEASGSSAGEGAEHAARPGRAAARANASGAGEQAGGRLRVFVSAGAGAQLAEQVQTVLGVADNECHLLARGASDSLLVSAETARAMRRCEAAVIIVTREDCAEDGGGPRRGLAAEISAADVIYGRRVALLWEKGLDVPDALAELLRFEFESDGLTWDIGIGLLKAVKDFQTRALDAA